jgi:murein DD-endopeptidase MepM/ murein hydrolase activator NlpD
MNVIFVSNNMAKARTLTLWQATALLFALVTVPTLLALSLILPQGPSALQAVNPARLLPSNFLATEKDTQEHINALALQLGQIQARVIRLDALSDRLAKLAGVKDKDLTADSEPGRGGPIARAHDMSANEIEQQMSTMLKELEQRSDRLNLLESLLLQRSLKQDTMPNKAPVESAYNSSSYGWRIDPFTGQMAFHEGLDFLAEAGAPIHAAASGIVVEADKTPDYGNIVKIDHGSGVETRYAHASKLLVKEGDRVTKGQLIAEVGNTGRSTGAHLHFEVRLNGVALDPRNYIKANHS